MTAQKVTFGDLLTEASDLVVRHGRFLALVTSAITASFLVLDWVDLKAGDRGGTALLSGLAGIVIGVFVQYRLVERLVADRRPSGQTDEVRRYGSLFGSLFISGLGIAAGLIVFILPGFYFGGRWLTSTQQIVENRMSAMEALRASWDESQPSQLVFIAANLIGLMPMGLIIGLTYRPDLIALPDDFWISSLLLDAVLALGNVAGWVIATAAHRLALPIPLRVNEVFD